jgi:hypothetical protein
MSLIRRGGPIVPAVFLVLACSTGTGQPTASPSAGPSSAPAATAPAPQTLDPSRSGAGIAGRVTLTGDSRAERDGVYEIYGLDGDGSECSGAFEEPGYTVVAYVDEAPNGQLRRLGITVGADDIPDADGTTSDITDGGVSFDFASETGVGTTYTGNSTRADEGSATISITRSGDGLVFDFSGVTFDAATFSGQLLCATSS